MDDEITKLDSPLDVMNLMHHAFDSLSRRVESLAAAAQRGGSLEEFQVEFNLWVKQLLYHATVEDEYMTPPLTDCSPARDNEAEHSELAQHGGRVAEYLAQDEGAEFSNRVRRVMLDLADQQHRELMGRLGEVQHILAKEVGRDRIIARTRRHLYQQVLELRILEYDHFENEEAFVMPLVQAAFNESEQLALVRRLLFEEGAENPRWIVDWVRQELSPTEGNLLAELETRLSPITTNI
ncbi:MAG: hemerythrin domain-containing protein [Dehalococcoidia bacterium]